MNRTGSRAAVDYGALDDAAMASLCAVGDAGAVRHLTGLNNQRLFRTAWAILKDRAEAEEAVQSAYLHAFAAIAGFEGRSSLSTWLTRIVVNEALGRRRAEERRRRHLENEGVALIDTYRRTLMQGSQSMPPDAAAESLQLRHLLEEAIGSLPEIFRTIFVLREIEEMSVDEAAEALDVPPATVKTRLHRARRMLRDALAPEVHTALAGTFPFAGSDCEKMTGRVLAALDPRGVADFEAGPHTP